uniref:Uncharacterized protein n=2 Tax=Fagus sylvatica TaxID=28930 RepID=A0A2N9EJN9_FAGSY
MPPRNSFGFVGSWLTWVLPRPPVLLFTATIVVLFTLPIMMFFMSAPSTLRSIVTSFVIIFSRVLFTYYLSPLRTSLLMSSPSPIHRDAYAILCPNSRWLLRHHLVFEGGYSDHTSKHQETNQIKDTNTKKTKTQESLEDEDGNGESFGMVLMSRSLSVSSSTSGFQSAMKRAFSLRRSSSVSERYCRIHDQSVTLTSPIDDDEVGDTMSGTRRSVKKNKYKGGKILKACKRLFGFGL